MALHLQRLHQGFFLRKALQGAVRLFV